MKTGKPIFKRLLAFTLVLLFSVTAIVPAMAQTAATGTYTITISNNEGLPAMTNDQYAAYQIFEGRVDTNIQDNRELADITWGNGVNAVELVTALKALTAASNPAIGDAFQDITAISASPTPAALSESAREVADILIRHKDDSVFLQAFAKIAATKKDDSHKITSTAINDPADPAKDESVIDVSTNGAGYYLVVDTKATGTDAFVPSYILDIVGTQKINLKAGVPTVDKNIVTGTNSTDRTKADSAGIGDTVSFEIIGTLAQNYGDFSEYTYKFTDTLSKGLTMTSPADIKVSIDGKELVVASSGNTAPYYKVTDKGDTGTEIVIDLGNLKALVGTNYKDGSAATITKDSKIVVTYSATVNSDAIIGNPGNPNKVDLTYSNDPNAGTTHTTDEVEVKVYAYRLDLTKAAEGNTDTKLSGAEFILSKVENGVTKYYKINGSTVTWESEKNNATSLTTDSTGKFTSEVIGLDAGVTYTLTEEKAPTGYNKVDPITFTINATVTAGGITNLSVDGIDDNDLVTDITGSEGTASEGNIAAGKIAIRVEDPKAPLLPFTGGMGITIFYMLGILLVTGAAIYFVLAGKKDKKVQNA